MIFILLAAGARGRNVGEMELEVPLRFRDLGLMSSKAERALGTCGHPPPWLTSGLQAHCEEGGSHLLLIFSQLRVTKHPLKW